MNWDNLSSGAARESVPPPHRSGKPDPGLSTSSKRLLPWALLALGGVLVQGQTPPATEDPEPFSTVLVESNLYRRLPPVSVPLAQSAALINTNRPVESVDRQLMAAPPAVPRSLSAPRLSIVDGQIRGGGSEYAVTFAPSLRTRTSVALQQRGGTVLRSTLLGLAYCETDTGRSVLIAGIRSVPARLVGTQQVLYADAFDGDGGLEADVVYSCGARAFEQDVVIRTQLPDPAGYGFNPATTELAVLTEFIEAPVPVARFQSLDLSQWNAALDTQVGPLWDEILGVGRMRLVLGRAFSLDNRQETIPVRKSWQIIEGRQVLIESTPFELIEPLGRHLPQPGASLPLRPPQGPLELPRFEEETGSGEILTAQVDPLGSGGVVMDYVLVTSPLLNVNLANSSWTQIGPAAVGEETNDFWNLSDSTFNSGTVTYSNLWWSDSTESTVDYSVQNAPGLWGNGITNSPMYHTFAYSQNGQSIQVTLTEVPEDVYDLYVYAHPDSDTVNGLFKLRRNGVLLGYRGTTIWGHHWANTQWTEGEQYVVFRDLSVGTNDTLQIESMPVNGYAHLSGFQLVPSAAVSAPVPEIERLINVDLCASATNKTGWAAVGQDTNDVWNLFQHPWVTYAVQTNLVEATGAGGTVGLIVSNAPGYWGTDYGPIDPMFDAVVYPWNGGNITLTPTNLPVGYYDVYVYAHSGLDGANAKLGLSCNGVDYGTKGTSIWGEGWKTPWQESQQYVVFRQVAVTNGAAPVVTVYPDGTIALANGLQLLKRVDGDEDGLPDAWEVEQFGHLGQGSEDDPDGDGLNNLAEYQHGTDPQDADSDGDGLWDPLELALGTDPLTSNPTEGTGGALGLEVFTPLH